MLIAVFNSCAQDKQTGFPDQINTKKTDGHQRILGTKIFAIIPTDYQYIKELARYQKNDKLYVQFIESNASSFIEAKPNFSREVIESKGASIDVLKDIACNEFECIYGEGPSKYPSETKLMMIFGDKNFVVMIAGVCKNSDTEGKTELQEIFKTVFYEKALEINPMELADFDFEMSITNFKYAMTASNMFMFTENGKSDAQNPTANSMNIGMMPQMTETKAEEYANDLPWRFERSGIKLENKDIRKQKIGEYTAFVLDTKIEFQNKDGILYQAVLVGKEKCILFMGSAYNDLDNYSTKYKKTVESIKIE